MSALYEIHELDNGDIVLRRADEKGTCLLSIQFSKESLSLLGESKLDVAKAMIEAGMDVVYDINERGFEESSDFIEDVRHSLH